MTDLANFDPNVLMDIYEDEDMVKECLCKFITLTFNLSDGLLSVIINLYIQKNWVDLKRESHSLKGRARYF
jgi:hypothetical protein